MIEILCTDICGQPMLQFHRKNEWNSHNKISILIEMSSLQQRWCGGDLSTVHRPRMITTEIGKKQFSGRVELVVAGWWLEGFISVVSPHLESRRSWAAEDALSCRHG